MNKSDKVNLIILGIVVGGILLFAGVVLYCVMPRHSEGVATSAGELPRFGSEVVQIQPHDPIYWGYQYDLTGRFTFVVSARSSIPAAKAWARAHGLSCAERVDDVFKPGGYLQTTGACTDFREDDLICVGALPGTAKGELNVRRDDGRFTLFIAK